MLNSLFATFLKGLGHPVALERMLKERQDVFVPLAGPSRTIKLWDVPPWHELGDYQKQAGHLVGWRAGTNGRAESFWRTIPALSSIAHEETTHACFDISELGGFANSKSELSLFTSLDSFVKAQCSRFVLELSEQALQKNLAHREIRILHDERTSDHFVRHMWDGPLCLSNSGGSHHLAAARYIAVRLGTPVPLKGRLKTISLNPHAVHALRSEFELFVISGESSVQNAFHDAMEAAQATWLSSKMCCRRELEADRMILLPRSDSRSMRAAACLRNAGIADLGEHLANLLSRQEHRMAMLEENGHRCGAESLEVHGMSPGQA